MKKKLIVTGCGIKALSHFTNESIAAIEQADIVLFLVNEPITAQWLIKKSQKSESLEDIYFSAHLRTDAYKKIVERILFVLSQYDNVCVVVYGHPLLLSNSIEFLIKKIDRNSIDLIFHPGISAFDCLLADLEIDPWMGCFSIEANEFIIKDKSIDSTNHLIIWQVGAIGDHFTVVQSCHMDGISLLKNKLLKSYDARHQCVLYEASIYPHIPFQTTYTVISKMDQIPLTRITTAYIPPKIENESRGF